MKLIVVIIFLVFSNIIVSQENIKSYQNLSIEDLLTIQVVTASKKLQPLIEAPAIITVITEQMIEQFGYKNIPELISFVPGFTKVDSYWKKDIITARGVKPTLYNDKILLLVDGIPVYGAPSMEYYLNLIPINAIKRIEIIRGPGSTLYGTNAFAGVINILTKSGKTNTKFYTHLTLGSFGHREVSVSFGNQIDDLSYFFSSVIKDDDGYNKTTKDEVGQEGIINYEKDFSSFFTKISYKSLALSSGYSYEKWGKFGGIPRFLFSNLNHIDNGRAIQNQFFINLGFDKKFNDDLSCKLSFHYDKSENQTDIGRLVELLIFRGLGLIDTTVSPDYAAFSGELYNLDLQVNYSLNSSHKLIFGATFEKRNNIKLGGWYSDLNGFELYSGSSKILPFFIDNYDLYLQVNGELTKQIKYIGGIRYSYLGISENSNLSPKGGLVINPTKQTAIKILYGEAFRGASAIEQFFFLPNVIVGKNSLGKKLNPEKIQTIEIGIEHLFFGNLQVKLSGFKTKIKNLIGRRSTTLVEKEILKNNALVYDNLDEQNLRGIEADLNYSPNNSSGIFLNFTIKDGEDVKTNETIPYLSKLCGNFGWFYNFTKKLKISSKFQFIGEREGFYTQNNELKSNTVKSFILCDFQLGYDVSENLNISFSVDNIFNKEYFYPEQVRKNMPTIPGGPNRSFYFKISYQDIKF